jgi:hypothetical protein
VLKLQFIRKLPDLPLPVFLLVVTPQAKVVGIIIFIY